MDTQWVYSLVDQQEPESGVLEFKRQLYSSEDKGRKEFASDVVSFANSHGGTIVIGIEEDGQGHAKAIVPINGSEETEIQRLDSWLARQVFPRLRTYSLRDIQVDGGFVLVLQIPQQFSGPFQAIHGSWTRFPIRTGRQTADMDYWQLATSFGYRSRIENELRMWRKSRVAQLKDWIRAGRLEKSAWAFFHVLPFASFSEQLRVDLGTVRSGGFNFRNSRGTTRFNLDGLMVTLAPAHTTPRTEYAQFFRNGAVEHGWPTGNSAEGEMLVLSQRLAGKLFDTIPRIAAMLGQLGIEGSIAVALTLLNVEGRRLENWDVQSGFKFPDHSELFTEDAVEIDEVVTADLSSFARSNQYLPSMMSELFQAFGVDKCSYFDADGTLRSGLRLY